MLRKVTKRMGLGSLLLLCALAVSALPASAVPRPYIPPAAGAIGIVCTTGPTFNLKATDGYISTPDGNSLYMWGYAEASGSFQMPGPTLCVNQGDTVTVNLTNELSEPVSIVFPGQIGVTASMVTGSGVSGLFTLEAAPGETVSYSFVADEPGTYLYESGTEPHKQVQMGLRGFGHPTDDGTQLRLQRPQNRVRPQPRVSAADSRHRPASAPGG